MITILITIPIRSIHLHFSTLFSSNQHFQGVATF